VHRYLRAVVERDVRLYERAFCRRVTAELDDFDPVVVELEQPVRILP